MNYFNVGRLVHDSHHTILDRGRPITNGVDSLTAGSPTSLLQPSSTVAAVLVIHSDTILSLLCC